METPYVKEHCMRLTGIQCNQKTKCCMAHATQSTCLTSVPEAQCRALSGCGGCTELKNAPAADGAPESLCIEC